MQATLTTTVILLALASTALSQETASSIFESSVEFTATSELDQVVEIVLEPGGAQGDFSTGQVLFDPCVPAGAFFRCEVDASE